MMPDSKELTTINILRYFLFSFVVLAVTGLLFKTLFFTYNIAHFEDLSFTDVIYALFWGIRFDFASAAFFTLFSSIIVWFFCRFMPTRSPALFLLIFFVVAQASMQLGDTLYFIESGRHVSYEMRDVIADATGLFMTAVQKHSLFIIFSYFLVVLSLVFIARIYARSRLHSTDKTWLESFKLKHEARLFVVMLISIVFIRGGFIGLPLSVTSAYKIGDAKQAVISMNGAYSIVYGVLNSSKEVQRVNVNVPGGVDIDQVMSALYTDQPGFNKLSKLNKHDDATNKKYNLVYILMEGWPADLMSAYGYAESTTPFFSSLKESSLAPKGVIAGGVRTTEGIYSIFCSQQNPLGKTVSQTSLQNNQYECLPTILKKQGWHAAFFQGSHKETSGTGAFAQSLGFTESFAKEDMPTGRYEQNFWGVHDPDIYDFVLSKLDDMPQPFIIGVNTNSTHDIKVPDGADAHFGEADNKQSYLSVLYFADQSMKEFFDKVRQKSYYKNTIFVLVSDHTGGELHGVASRYSIPGIIYAEDIVPSMKIDSYVSQRDFSPTILDILGLPASRTFAGKSFWSESNHGAAIFHIAEFFDAGSIGWIADDALVQTSVINPDDIKCYSISEGLPNASSIVCDESHKRQSIKSLVFTSYSQDLLFNGRTKKFYDFLDE